MSMYAAITSDHLRNLLEDSREGLGGNGWAAKTGEFLDQMRSPELSERLKAIRENRDYAEAYKEARAAEAVSQFKDDQERRIREIERAYQEKLEAVRDGAKPRRLAANPADSEARLGNARADARMMLDSVPPEQVISHMAQLAQGDDEAMAHLLLATSWPTHYLASRRVTSNPSTGGTWEQVKAPLLSRVYDPQAAGALERLTRLERFKGLGDDLRHILASWQPGRV